MLATPQPDVQGRAVSVSGNQPRGTEVEFKHPQTLCTHAPSQRPGAKHACRTRSILLKRKLAPKDVPCPAPTTMLEEFAKTAIDNEGVGPWRCSAVGEMPRGASVPALGLSNKAVYEGDEVPLSDDRHYKEEFPAQYFIPVDLTAPACKGKLPCVQPPSASYPPHDPSLALVPRVYIQATDRCTVTLLKHTDTYMAPFYLVSFHFLRHASRRTHQLASLLLTQTPDIPLCAGNQGMAMTTSYWSPSQERSGRLWSQTRVSERSTSTNGKKQLDREPALQPSNYLPQCRQAGDTNGFR
ncbi:hypothetical protein PR048_033047 [Dryococelus australis]|uniref:Uncharacterized protein n=1 Tax=Dryococelus australis TaxID=614101 RepID=A0ABQ9G294_9NEOP|nr:hypothetical protein PR048_033047 [Dryococelus australis]